MSASKSPCLVIIDIQNDYFPGGKFELVNQARAAENAKKALELFRQKQWHVAHIQHLMPIGGLFFETGSHGAEIHELVKPLENEVVFQKDKPSSFLDTGLAAFLAEREVDHIVVVGSMSHICVDTTVRAAMDYGLTVTLLHDACATKDLEFEGRKVAAADVQAAFMAAIAFFFATLKSTDQYIKEHQG